MFRRLYDWTLQLAEKPYALWALAVVSFVESSVFPIPPDILLIPMVLAAPHRAWLIAGVCTLASVAGGALGYLIGAQLYDVIGEPVLAFYGKEEAFAAFGDKFNEHGMWAVLFAGLTPFPYKVITIASGATGLNFWVFMISSLVARAARFFLVAALLWKYGSEIREFIDRYFGWLTLAFFVLLAAGFAVLKYI